MTREIGDMRYSIVSFPSVFGTPWEVDNKWLAYLLAWVRSAVSLGSREVRVIDRVSGNHIMVL